jgi:hypothetical protein
MDEVVKVIAGNKKNRKEIIIFLLDQHGADMIIINKVMKVAAKNKQNKKKIIIILLN